MKKTLSYIVIISSLFVISFIIADFIISNKVKKRLSKEPSISYTSFNVNVLTGSLELEGFKFYDSIKDIQADYIYLNVDVLLYTLKKDIKIENLEVKGLNLKYNTTLVKVANNKITLDAASPVEIKAIKISQSSVEYTTAKGKRLRINEIDLAAKNARWPLDINFDWLMDDSFTIKAKDLHYDLDDLHDLTIDDLSFKNRKVDFKNFKIKPKYTQQSYIRHIKIEKDLMDLDAKLISLEGLELVQNEDKLQLSLDKILLDSTNFNIYRDKTISDDTSYKPLYSESLRDLGFDLLVDSILVSKLAINYQELFHTDRPPGDINFESIDVQITNLHNGINKEKSEIAVIASGKLSKQSQILFTMSLNPSQERFKVSTLIKDVEDSSVNTFLAPAMRMKLEGKINRIETAFIGTNSEAKGEFKIAYKNLKLKILNKRGGENHFASLLSNVFVNNKDVDKTIHIDKVKRDTTKSFWNYLWKIHLKGLEQSLL
ncbi:hypothetical protein [Psychroflexus sp. MES1-P1E]|uniref:hypothetical protein n=1 Tax=Psychroflexus sp. MES1-P1E TaxID=2058320 RepID=UPI000C7B7593|nr:hypothetical protein [Psychroflexus sp. MES1-P1E]PKG43514.1 hypothetical protein CXF67_04795 [Psychroflexus sp. MES1-P1E]